MTALKLFSLVVYLGYLVSVDGRVTSTYRPFYLLEERMTTERTLATVSELDCAAICSSNLRLGGTCDSYR